jgi:hypothetical protein
VAKATGGLSYAAEDSCLLHPGTPLIVIEHPVDERILADMQGNSSVQWPLCPAGIMVSLSPTKIIQKPAVIRRPN